MLPNLVCREQEDIFDDGVGVDVAKSYCKTALDPAEHGLLDVVDVLGSHFSQAPHDSGNNSQRVVHGDVDVDADVGSRA